MKKLTGKIGEGYLAFFELDLVLRREPLFRRTRFFEKGKEIRPKGRYLVHYLRSLFKA